MSVFTEAHWTATLHLNAVRVVSSTVTLVVLYFFGRLSGVLSGQGWEKMSILNLIALPAGLLLVGLATIMVLRLAGSMGVPFTDAIAGLASVMMIVFIAIGDPLIWIVRKYYPEIVPVEQFNFVNLSAVLMVQRS